MLTVSNHQGDTPFDSFIVKGDPSNVRWCPNVENQTIVCCIISGTKIFHFNPKNSAHSFIEFDKAYGKITVFEWFDDTTLMVAFTTG
jgi:hypothetical protein